VASRATTSPRYSPIVEDGHITSVSCVATDVTSVKATARALAEREQRLELAVRAADIGYWHWDARADQVTWDAISCRHLGVPVDVGTTSYAGFLARVHPLDRDRIRAEVDDAMARGLYPGLRFRALAPSGEPRWLMTIGSVERAGAEITGLDGCLVDVTARTRLEQQLAQAQRMDAVGQLAAGVAHNFNNLLAAILPALELAGRRAPDTAPLLAEVRAAAERSADVVRQLMSFAGGAAPGTVDQACDAAAVARSVVQLARAMIDRRYELSLHAPSAPVPVRAEAGEPRARADEPGPQRARRAHREQARPPRRSGSRSRPRWATVPCASASSTAAPG
jgi:PAS domain-containing protein